MSLESLLLPLIFLLASVAFSTLSKAMQALGKLQIKKEFDAHRGFYYFYFLVKKLFPKDGWNNLTFLNGSTKQITRILYATTFIFYFLSQNFFSSIFIAGNHHILLKPSIFILIITIIVFLGLFFDFLGTLLGSSRPLAALKLFYPIASIFLTFFCPVTFILLKLQKLIFAKDPKDLAASSPYKIKDKILELVLESDLQHELSPQEKRLMLSVASFKDRIAREIMVPRINVVILPSHSSIQEAALCFAQEGYSRIPVYKQSPDNIIGVLLYKDLLRFYLQTQKQQNPETATIENILKPILYTPETKKISNLLQEFRSKQIHLAIVVDEYGGTEGVVTIEDILEELVGEIADEYDNAQEELLFQPHPQGGWVVDAKMSIIDIEKELGIPIPHSPEYDTLGGYIF
ncbi:MAG: HlyC/CorC family transporter, partial [Chlamydiae bacterium]|nr:HlyC/CorC family transporter [Chlamydiota bacterium]